MNNTKTGFRLYVIVGIVLLVLIIWHLLDVQLGVYESKDTFLVAIYLGLGFFSLIIYLIVGYMITKGIKLERIYALSIVSMGILYMLVFPPLSAPDEISHYMSAYKLSNIIMGTRITYDGQHTLIRSKDLILEDPRGEYIFDEELSKEKNIAVYKNTYEDIPILGKTLTADTYHVVYGGLEYKDFDYENAVSYYPTVMTTKLVYLPQAIGIIFARLVGLGGVGLAFAGRFFNLAFFAFITYLAMIKLPFGKEILYGISILPMTLHLASSFSYDTMIIGMITYFIAYCLHLAYVADRVRWKDVFIVALTVAVILPCKIAYGPVLLLCFIIPVRKFGSKKRWLASAIFIFITYITAMYLVHIYNVGDYSVSSGNVADAVRDPNFCLGYIRDRPLDAVKIIYNTLLLHTRFLYESMLGGYLGSIDKVVGAPKLVVSALGVLLILISMKVEGKSRHIIGRERNISLWILVLCSIAVFFAMLLTLTPISAEVIAGLQGRYFLPILILFLLSIQNNYIVLKKDLSLEFLLIMHMLTIYTAVRVFSIVCMRIIM